MREVIALEEQELASDRRDRVAHHVAIVQACGRSTAAAEAVVGVTGSVNVLRTEVNDGDSETSKQFVEVAAPVGSDDD